MVVSASGAGDRVAVLHAGRQRGFVPGASAAFRPEDLTEAADAIYLVGVARMQSDSHHGAVGLDTVVEPLPGLTEILAAVERTVLAPGGRAQARIQRARIGRRHPDVTGVRERREATDLHVFPASA